MSNWELLLKILTIHFCKAALRESLRQVHVWKSCMKVLHTPELSGIHLCCHLNGASFCHVLKVCKVSFTALNNCGAMEQLSE